MSKGTFDIIILGGGLVGLALANLCAKADFRVALVEGNEPKLLWPKEGYDTSYDIRCSAITPASQKIFETIGVWDEIVKERVSPFRYMKVWDGVGFGEIAFDALELRTTELGHIIENRVMIKALWEKAKENKNITFFCPNKPVSFFQEKDQAILNLEQDEIKKEGIIQEEKNENKISSRIAGKLIVGADGGKSWLRNAAGISVSSKDYEQSALVATVETSLPHQETAWQVFLPEGPLAFLPLTHPNYCSIVWTGTKENTEKRKESSVKDFCAELDHAFDYRLGQIVSVESRQSFPLLSLHTKQYVLDRLALVGDSAHVIHPLAGQGVNLGFLDAARLSAILKEGRKKKVDIGNRLWLRRYERARKGHNQTMLLAMGGFKQLFGTSFSLMTGLRSVGLNVTNQATWLKNEIMSRAMGWKDLPEIL